MALSEDEVKDIYVKPGAYGGGRRSIAKKLQLLSKHAVKRAFYNTFALRREAFDGCSLTKGSSVLVLCAGNGLDLEYFVDRVGTDARIVLLDFSPTLLEAAKEQIAKFGLTNTTTIEANAARDLGLPDQFDLVCCQFGFSVIPEWEEAYKNLVKYCKIGGDVLVTDISLGVGWREKFNPVLLWTVSQYGGTEQGLGNLRRLLSKMEADTQLENVTPGIKGYCGYVRARRKS